MGEMVVLVLIKIYSPALGEFTMHYSPVLGDITITHR
jgi:hypothetical protein